MQSAHLKGGRMTQMRGLSTATSRMCVSAQDTEIVVILLLELCHVAEGVCACDGSTRKWGGGGRGGRDLNRIHLFKVI